MYFAHPSKGSLDVWCACMRACMRVCVCVCVNVVCVHVVCVWVQECDKKEADSELNAKTSRERYQAKCHEMGIKVGSVT